MSVDPINAYHKFYPGTASYLIQWNNNAAGKEWENVILKADSIFLHDQNLLQTLKETSFMFLLLEEILPSVT